MSRRRDAPAAAADRPIIEVEEISKIYHPLSRAMRVLVKSPIDQPVYALSDISLTVARGEICVVVGPNGEPRRTMSCIPSM